MTDEDALSDAELMEVYQEPAPKLSARAARILLALAGGMAALAAFALAFSWIDSTSSDATCGSVVESSYWRDGRPADCGTVMPIRAALVALFVVVAVVLIVRATRRVAVTKAWKVAADVVITASLLALIVNEIVRVDGLI
jgi:hypothetical protein